MAERSKARGSGPRLARGVGSNPTDVKSVADFSEKEGNFGNFRPKKKGGCAPVYTVSTVAE